jgi:hypothetical protein
VYRHRECGWQEFADRGVADRVANIRRKAAAHTSRPAELIVQRL